MTFTDSSAWLFRWAVALSTCRPSDASAQAVSMSPSALPRLGKRSFAACDVNRRDVRQHAQARSPVHFRGGCHDARRLDEAPVSASSSAEVIGEMLQNSMRIVTKALAPRRYPPRFARDGDRRCRSTPAHWRISGALARRDLGIHHVGDALPFSKMYSADPNWRGRSAQVEAGLNRVTARPARWVKRSGDAAQYISRRRRVAAVRRGLAGASALRMRELVWKRPGVASETLLVPCRECRDQCRSAADLAAARRSFY